MSVKDTLPTAQSGVMCTPDWVLTALAAALREERRGNTGLVRRWAAVALARVRWMRLQLPEAEQGRRRSDYLSHHSDRELLRVAVRQVLFMDTWGDGLYDRYAEAALRTLIKRLDARLVEASPGRAGGGAGPAIADVIATGPAHTREDPL